MFTGITNLVAITLLSAVAHMPADSLNDSVPKLVTSCESPVQGNWTAQQASLDSAAGLEVLKRDVVERVSLVKSGTAFGLRFENPQSDHANVVKVEGIQLDSHSFHIILDVEHGTAQHFLFSLDLDGSGELLWSSADSSALTNCFSAVL